MIIIKIWKIPEYNGINPPSIGRMDNDFNFESNIEIQRTASWKPKY